MDTENKLNEYVNDPILSLAAKHQFLKDQIILNTKRIQTLEDDGLVGYNSMIALKEIRNDFITIDCDIKRLALSVRMQSDTINRMSRGLLFMSFCLLACSILWWFR
jgi:hypothetical protein